MEEHGLIVENKGEEALVKITRHSLCSKCTNKCPMAVDDHETDEIEVQVINPIGAEKGQLVKIEMEEKPLVFASLLIYLVPLLFLIAGYFVGIYFAGIIFDSTPGEGAGIIGSIVFLLLSFVCVSYIDKTLSKKKKYQPLIKEIINSSEQ